MLAQVVEILIAGLEELKNKPLTAPLGTMPTPAQIHSNSAYSLLIVTLERLGRRREAEAWAKEWYLRAPNESLTQFTYGRVLLQNGNLDAALERLHTAEGIDQRPETKYQIARALFKKGDLAGAESMARLALTGFEARKLDRVEADLKRTRDELEAERKRAEEQAKTGTDVAKPQDILAKRKASLLAKKQSEKKAAGDSVAMANVRYLQGQMAMARAGWEEADSAMQDAHTLSPRLTRALIQRGRALEEMGRGGEAMQLYIDGLTELSAQAAALNEANRAKAGPASSSGSAAAPASGSGALLASRPADKAVVDEIAALKCPNFNAAPAAAESSGFWAYLGFAAAPAPPAKPELALPVDPQLARLCNLVAEARR